MSWKVYEVNFLYLPRCIQDQIIFVHKMLADFIPDTSLVRYVVDRMQVSDFEDPSGLVPAVFQSDRSE